MAIVLSIVLFTAVAGILNGLSRDRNNIIRPDSYKKFFCVFVTLIWILLSGLRHYSVGADTYAYGNSFYAAINSSWETLWETFVDRFFKDAFTKDPGYELLEKAFSYISTNYQHFLIFIALVFFIPMGIWIYRNSRMPYVSFLLFSCLFYSFFAVTGHRQTIATALVVFVGGKFIRERKLIKFLLITALAATIHASCLCYLLVYWIYPIKNYKATNYFWLSIIGIILIVTVADPLWEWVATRLHYTNFLDNDIGGTGTYCLLFMLVYFLAIWRMPVIVRDRPDAYAIYNILFVGALMIAMAFVNQSFMRVQQYFTLHLMLILPEMVLSFRFKDRALVGVAGCSILFFFFIRNIPYYKFFWQ